MAQRRFTEGPWRVEWTKDSLGCPMFSVIKVDGDADDDGRMVDASYSIIEEAFPVLATDEDKANADLIAAAPDLYDALMRLRAAAKACCADQHALMSADMALAYARGEDFRGYDE